MKLRLVEASGTEHEIEAQLGRSLMDNAVKNNVPGIAADCGGVCACGTCRVYPSEAWRDKLREPNEMEQSMLEYLADSTPGVRLSCQIEVTPELDGLTVHMPETQY